MINIAKRLNQTILTLLLLSTMLIANEIIEVTQSVDREDYADKSIENLQREAIQKAKLEAASQIFGDFIKSTTVIKDGSMIKDLITAKQGGIIHIKGDPLFSNGANLGELQVTINAYATQKDISDMQVRRIVLSDFKYSNKNLTLKQLKQAAKDAFLIEAISQKKPSITTQENALAQAKSFALSVNIQKMDFNEDWLAYKISGYVEYVPIFLRNDSALKKPKKPEATLSLMRMNGGMKKFKLFYDEKGLHFTKEALKYIKKESSRNQVFMNLTAKLMIPKKITDDAVEVKALSNTSKTLNGTAYYKSYINDLQIAKAETKYVDVEREGKSRYVKLSVKIICYKGRYKKGFKSIVKELESLKYRVFDPQNESKSFALKTK